MTDSAAWLDWVVLPTIPGPTARTRFRPYRLSDVAAVEAMFDDPQARRFYPNLSLPGAAERWIEWNLSIYATDGVGLWVIEGATLSWVTAG